MTEKDELIKQIKNLAVTPSDYRNGTELIKLMDFYNVNSLYELTVDQCKEYLKEQLNK